MKTINTIRLLAALLAAVLLCSCTQNNGHIGKLFGTWVLTERLADGAAIEKPYDADAYMSFQNNIVHFRTVENNYDLIEYKTATWIRMGDSLSFDFDNTSDAGNPDLYSAPAWLEPVWDRCCDEHKPPGRRTSRADAYSLRRRNIYL